MRSVLFFSFSTTVIFSYSPSSLFRLFLLLRYISSWWRHYDGTMTSRYSDVIEMIWRHFNRMSSHIFHSRVTSFWRHFFVAWRHFNVFFSYRDVWRPPYIFTQYDVFMSHHNWSVFFMTSCRSFPTVFYRMELTFPFNRGSFFLIFCFAFIHGLHSPSLIASV